MPHQKRACDLTTQDRAHIIRQLHFGTGTREKCAVAYENLRLLCIPVEEYQGGMVEHRELYDYTLRLLGQRLAYVERRVEAFALNAVPVRLEKLLAELSEQYGIVDGADVLIDLALPHREIASLVGSTRASLAVRLNTMRRAGIIDFVDRKILIIKTRIARVMVNSE